MTKVKRLLPLENFNAGLALLALLLIGINVTKADVLELEKDELKFGFIKLTDMAPSMELNGNGIIVPTEVWAMMKNHIPVQVDRKPIHSIKANALKFVVDSLNRQFVRAQDTA